jgi:hypothetical protein
MIYLRSKIAAKVKTKTKKEGNLMKRENREYTTQQKEAIMDTKLTNKKEIIEEMRELSRLVDVYQYYQQKKNDLTLNPTKYHPLQEKDINFLIEHFSNKMTNCMIKAFELTGVNLLSKEMGNKIKFLTATLSQINEIGGKIIEGEQLLSVGLLDREAFSAWVGYVYEQIDELVDVWKRRNKWNV